MLIQSTCCGCTNGPAHREERESALALGNGYARGRVAAGALPTFPADGAHLFLDDRRPWLLLFLPLAQLFICLLAPPGQRGGSETQIPLIWFFSNFDEGLDRVGVWRSWIT